MLVGGDGVLAEAVGGRFVDRQRVVMAHHDRFAVARLEQLGRKRAVKGPDGVRLLNRHARVQLDRDAVCRTRQHSSDVVVEPARPEFTLGVPVPLKRVAETAVGTCGGLGGLEELLGKEFGPTLLGPVFSRWPAFGRSRHAAGRRNKRVAEESFYGWFPEVLIYDVREPGWVRRDSVLGQKCLQLSGIRSAL